jgi:hypothetical protein
MVRSAISRSQGRAVQFRNAFDGMRRRLVASQPSRLPSVFSPIQSIAFAKKIPSCQPDKAGGYDRRQDADVPPEQAKVLIGLAR